LRLCSSALKKFKRKGAKTQRRKEILVDQTGAKKTGEDLEENALRMNICM